MPEALKYELTTDKNLIGPWVYEKVGLTWGPEGREAIGVTSGKKVLSGVVFENLTGISCQCHIAVEGGLRMLLPAIFQYAYGQLGVEKMIVMINSNNLKSVSFCLKLNFEAEAIIKDVYPEGGDMVVLVQYRRNCYFLTPEQRAA